MKKLNFLDKLLFFFNSIAATLLLITYVVPYIDPEKNSTIAIFCLSYSALLVANVIFLIFWIIKLKPHFLLSVITIGIGFSYFTSFYSFSKKEILKQQDVKLLTYNVRHFNSGAWIPSPTVKQDICTFINKQNPDVLFFQEYVNTKGLTLNLPLKHEVRTPSSGLAIYSKYKKVNAGEISFKGTSNSILFADLKINDEIIRFYNVHIQSFGLNTHKKNYGDKNKDALLNRFKRVFKQQAHQIKTLKEHIKKCPYRTIVAGDFNNTAFSWCYHQLIKDRKDAFVEAGEGLGRSYNYFFPFRIDFILAEKNMKVGAFTTFNVNLSDHYPIMARINLNN